MPDTRAKLERLRGMDHTKCLEQIHHFGLSNDCRSMTPWEGKTTHFRCINAKYNQYLSTLSLCHLLYVKNEKLLTDAKSYMLHKFDHSVDSGKRKWRTRLLTILVMVSATGQSIHSFYCVCPVLHLRIGYGLCYWLASLSTHSRLLLLYPNTTSSQNDVCTNALI